MRELGLNPSDEELKDLVNEADLNKDGVISFDGRLFRLHPAGPLERPVTADPRSPQSFSP